MRATATRISIVALLASASIAQAQGQSERIADFVNGYLKKKQIPGCAVMVRHEGKVVHCAGYGLANLEQASRSRLKPSSNRVRWVSSSPRCWS